MPDWKQYTFAIKFLTVTCMLQNNVFTKKSILALITLCGLSKMMHNIQVDMAGTALVLFKCTLHINQFMDSKGWV